MEMLAEMDDAKIEAWLSSDLPNGEEEGKRRKTTKPKNTRTIPALILLQKLTVVVPYRTQR
jgi:hypothetical protein